MNDSTLEVRSEPRADWHACDAADALRDLRTGPEGLDDADAAARLKLHGANVIPRGKRDTALDLVWRQVHNPLIWVLIGSAVVAMAVDPTDGIKNGLVILAVVILNTLIGFVQESKANRAIEALSRMVPENATVVRARRKLTLPAADLVPGDVVLLASGDKVPADLRLVQLRNLQVEEAALTGESMPAQKQLAPVDAGAGIGDRTSMAFGGTLVTYGTASGVVVATGERTELGRISTMLKETTDLQTPLTLALAKIGWIITVSIVVISLAMLALGTWRSVTAADVSWITALRETIIFAIALAVGAIPEGLPAIVTIALAIGVQRMAARNAVVRRLPAVETLGSTTVICSDKTGTLTRNEMTVQALWTPASGAFELTGVGYEPKGWLQHDGEAVTAPSDAADLLLAGALCNDATLENVAGQWKVHGDPTEGALVVAAEKAGIDVSKARERHRRLDVIPFESENQFMATVNAHDGSGRVVLKGAPEAVMQRCTGAADGAHDQVEALAARGMRVLAFAAKPAPGVTTIEMDDVSGGFTLLGLQGMIDPPRPEAVEAIAVCQRAGITVKMITGDHKATAQAIAAQIGILPADPRAPRAVDGAQLAAAPALQLEEMARAANVFARVAPEHKLSIVRALQGRGQVVAMTGDGVNDAPALKQANIGVAMGITGTSVSKEAAAIVLTDDNFASIAAAVEEGRRVYDNLIKSLAFVLPTNLGLALILMWAVAFFPFGDVTRVIDGVAVTAHELLLPMSPAQLLWINLVAGVALALPLAFEAKEPDVMDRPPRPSDAPVLSGFVVMRTFLVALLMTAGAVGLFLYEYRAAGGLDALAKAQTMAVTTVVMFQIFYMLNCRSLRDSIVRIGLVSNPTVFAGIAAIVALQALFIYAPFMHVIFGSAPLSTGDLFVSVLVGAVVLPVVGVEKWWRRRGGAPSGAASALRTLAP